MSTYQNKANLWIIVSRKRSIKCKTHSRINSRIKEKSLILYRLWSPISLISVLLRQVRDRSPKWLNTTSINQSRGEGLIYCKSLLAISKNDTYGDSDDSLLSIQT